MNGSFNGFRRKMPLLGCSGQRKSPSDDGQADERRFSNDLAKQNRHEDGPDHAEKKSHAQADIEPLQDCADRPVGKRMPEIDGQRIGLERGQRRNAGNVIERGGGTRANPAISVRKGPKDGTGAVPVRQ